MGSSIQKFKPERCCVCCPFCQWHLPILQRTGSSSMTSLKQELLVALCTKQLEETFSRVALKPSQLTELPSSPRTGSRAPTPSTPSGSGGTTWRARDLKLAWPLTALGQVT